MAGVALEEGSFRIHVSGLHGMLCFELRLSGTSEYRERYAGTFHDTRPGVVCEEPLGDALVTRLRRLFERALRETQPPPDLHRDPIRLTRRITLERQRGGQRETHPRWVVAGREDSEFPPGLIALLRFCEERIESLPDAPVPPTEPVRALGALPEVPKRADLEARLSLDGRHVLDGSFPSLWALDHIVSALRVAPGLQSKAGWIATYLTDLFERAFREMQMTVERPSSTRIRTTAPLHYEVDVAADLLRLYGEPGSFVAFKSVPWATDRSPLVGTLPGYGLGTIFQSHPWAQAASAARIQKAPDRIDRGLAWLAAEQAGKLDVGAPQRALALAVVRALMWPPIGFTDNARGEQNRSQVSVVLRAAEANAAREVTDALVASGDDGLRVLGACAAIESGVPPDTEDEGHAYAAAAQIFGLSELPPFIDRLSLSRLHRSRCASTGGRSGPCAESGAHPSRHLLDAPHSANPPQLGRDRRWGRTRGHEHWPRPVSNPARVREWSAARARRQGRSHGAVPQAVLHDRRVLRRAEGQRPGEAHGYRRARAARHRRHARPRLPERDRAGRGIQRQRGHCDRAGSVPRCERLALPRAPSPGREARFAAARTRLCAPPAHAERRARDADRDARSPTPDEPTTISGPSRRLSAHTPSAGAGDLRSDHACAADRAARRTATCWSRPATGAARLVEREGRAPHRPRRHDGLGGGR